MRLVVDALSARTGGGLSYVTRQLDALGRVRPDWQLVVMSAPWNSQAISSLHGRFSVKRVKVRSVADRLAFQQAILPFRLRSFDALYCPGNFIPLAARIPSIVTQQNPNYFGVGRQQESAWTPRMTVETHLARASIRRAEVVVVISKSLSAQMDEDGISSSNRHIILSGAPEWGIESTPPLALGIPSPFILSLANDYPHKNLETIVRAWVGLRHTPIPALILAGEVAEERRRMLLSLIPEPLRPHLLLLGSVTRQPHVRWLLENATALVSASCLEAFPLTPAEAGAVGCPTLLSDIPPHREVAGDNARYFPLCEPHALGVALDALLEDVPPRVPWHWPVTWDENAESLARLIEGVVVG